MLGAIIGDIIGSYYEFTGKKFYEPEINTFPLFMDKTSFTDDSVCTLAVAEWLMNQEIPLEDHLRSLCIKYPNRGYGQMFASWVEGHRTGPYNSWGNGSAMRVSPVGLYAKTEAECLDLAQKSAEVTHNHPKGIEGAQAVAMAIFLAKRKSSKDDIRKYLQDKFSYPLNRSIDEIRPDYRWSVGCDKTVPPAIIAALEADSFEGAIRKVISIGGDADTLAAITGSIAEQLYGVPNNLMVNALSYLDKDLFKLMQDFYYFLSPSEEMAS